MKPSLCGDVLLLGFAVHVHAQVVTEMTPELVQEAIAKGGSGIYKLQERTIWGDGPVIGYFTTPYSRVCDVTGHLRLQEQSRPRLTL